MNKYHFRSNDVIVHVNEFLS